MSDLLVGLLALQGALAPHERLLSGLGAAVRPVRVPEDLTGLDGLVLPGGESTTMGMLLDSSGLRQPLVDAIDDGLAVLATCAGLILLAAEVADGRADQIPLKRMDVAVRRNAYGRQNESFEGAVVLVDDPDPFDAVFIRAPAITSVGPDVEVLGRLGDEPVLVRQGSLVAASFHPELSSDARVHRLAFFG